MLLGMAAATSALDLIKTLTQAGASSKNAGSAKFSAGNPLTTTGAATSSRAGRSGLISADTMNALLAAQGQSDTSSPSATGRSAALKAQMLTTAATTTASSSVSVSV